MDVSFADAVSGGGVDHRRSAGLYRRIERCVRLLRFPNSPSQSPKC